MEIAIKKEINNPEVIEKFNGLLGDRSKSFISNVITCVQQSRDLQQVDTTSIILAAAQAAAIDLPLSLSYCAIVPFVSCGAKVAQLQVMRDGWIELAVRTGQFKYIVNEVVHDGELVYHNRFNDSYEFDESMKTSDNVIGYMASFELIGGYRKTIYWTVDQCKQHALKYSKTARNASGLWQTNFDAMALKTVLKHLIKKYAPKSTQIDRAIISDQAAFDGTIDDVIPDYVDNVAEDDEKIKSAIHSANSISELMQIWNATPDAKRNYFKPYFTNKKHKLS